MTFKSKFDWDNIKQIRDAVKKYDIHIINAQSSKDRYTSILANWIYRLNVNVFHTRRQTPKSSGIFLQNWFYTLGTKKIIAVSEGVKRQLADLGIPEKHITVIYNGTPRGKYKLQNPEYVEELRRKYRIQPDDKVIGCVSRSKQQEQLLKAVNLIDSKLKVILIGAEEKDIYRKITAKYKTAHEVIYTGFLSPEETLYHYKLFYIKVLPSITEGLSQALLEAMAMSVPVIATRAAGNIDLIKNGVNGYLFDENDIEDLAVKIKILLENDDVRKKFIENGKKNALEDFSIENTIEEYERFFQDYCR